MSIPIITYGAILPEGKIEGKTYRFDKPADFPDRVDLRDTTCSPYFPVWNQGTFNICSPMTLSAAFVCAERNRGKAGDNPRASMFPSTQFNYYYSRKRAGLPLGVDTGVGVGDCLRAAEDGLSSAAVFPWNGDIAQTPPIPAQRDARERSVVKWFRLQHTLDNFRYCLADGHPFLLTFAVTPLMQEWFTSPSLMKMTLNTLPLGEVDDTPVGGHAVLCLGYDNMKGVFLLRNSWGHLWGDDGHFFMDYLTMSNGTIIREAYYLEDICEQDKTADSACVVGCPPLYNPAAC